MKSLALYWTYLWKYASTSKLFCAISRFPPSFFAIFMFYHLCLFVIMCRYLQWICFSFFPIPPLPLWWKRTQSFSLIFSIIFPIFITCHAYDFEVFPLDKMVFTSSSLLFLFRTLDLMHRYFFYWLASLLSAFGRTFIVSLMIYFHKGRVFMILWVVFKTGLQLNHAEG